MSTPSIEQRPIDQLSSDQLTESARRGFQLVKMATEQQLSVGRLICGVVGRRGLAIEVTAVLQLLSRGLLRFNPDTAHILELPSQNDQADVIDARPLTDQEHPLVTAYRQQLLDRAGDNPAFEINAVTAVTDMQDHTEAHVAFSAILGLVKDNILTIDADNPIRLVRNTAATPTEFQSA